MRYRVAFWTYAWIAYLIKFMNDYGDSENQMFNYVNSFFISFILLWEIIQIWQEFNN